MVGRILPSLRHYYDTLCLSRLLFSFLLSLLFPLPSDITPISSSILLYTNRLANMASVDLSQYNGGSLIGVASTFLVLTWVSVFLRFYVRTQLTNGFQSDDWFMLVAQVSQLWHIVFMPPTDEKTFRPISHFLVPLFSRVLRAGSEDTTRHWIKRAKSTR